MTAIVDCNSFYCSCERLFRPDLRNKPVVVLSNNDGCIVSRSDEARALGVGMAVPYFEARHIIEKHGIAVFSSNYHLYGDLSYRVMETLRTLAGDRSKVEVYSVDEAFMDLSDVPEDQLVDHARHIKTTVEQWTGIPVSIGVAPTKTLAKLANRLAKKDKIASSCVTVIATAEEQRLALQQTRVDDLWGIGGAYAVKLINQGITSAWELSNMPEEWAHSHLGGVVGVRLIRELKGLPAIFMEEELVDKKMIATTRMFGRPVTSVTEIKEAVATYISRSAEKLRRQQSAAGVVSVFIVAKEQSHSTYFRHGPTISSYTTLPHPSCLTHELIKAATGLVDQLFEEGKSYKKAGVMLSGLVPDGSIQGNLFVPPAENQHRFLMHTIDNINFAMRDDSVKFGASGMNKDWKMRQELRSRRHSTRWEELKGVK
ncbi:Y-family DNA polymerase [Puia dinghuensis]|uniref:SOS mutagenesis and repair protein UmuC n=1 Tax=Puia dinghuensis TaxID=1792502 RepID=A0A8J2UFI6_9BACT|nr:Y-family DNA polymerase [Puia dinghuensis]GGB08783.1 SOS mutagenesis and repair protein UmuC [Puia dinghuensis]